MFVGSHLHSCAFICARAHSFSFAGGHIRSWAVGFAFAFVHGWLGSFLSGRERSHSFLSICVCSWAIVMLTRCGGGPLISVAAAPAQSQLKPEAEPSLAEAQPELPSGGSHISANSGSG